MSMVLTKPHPGGYVKSKTYEGGETAPTDFEIVGTVASFAGGEITVTSPDGTATTFHSAPWMYSVLEVTAQAPLVETEETHSIRRSLDALGCTGNQVAKTLHEAGIRGQRGSGTGCPIHNYVTMLDVVRDNHHHVMTWGVQTIVGNDTGAWVVPHGPAVMDFIAWFDGGLYPALESLVV